MDEKLCSGGKVNGAGPSAAGFLERAVAGGCKDASPTASDGVPTSAAMIPAKPVQTKRSATTVQAWSEDQERATSRMASIAGMGIAINVEL